MYGINEDIKKFIDKKIEKNKSFLKNLTFYNEDYQLISMFDSDINANLSPQRYYAEVANRVNTLFKYSRELDLYPAFLTITLPSEFHSNSSKYNGYTPKKSSLYLSDVWARFLRLSVFKKIRSNIGHNMIYIRVYEPHKDGTPHLHAMIFVPKCFLKEVKQKFYEHFKKYGFKKVGLKFITNFTHAKYEETKGAIAYILKYMNKTFKNALEDRMTDEAYYFAYHGIRRFITSQTLVPMWLYRKIKHDKDNRDLYQVTKKYKAGNIYHCFDKEYIVTRYLDRSFKYLDDEIIDVEIEVKEKVIYQKNHFISEQFKTNTIQYEKVPIKWKKQDKHVPIIVNDVLKFTYYKGEYKSVKKHITDMSDLELMHKYQNYDIDNDSYVHYLAIRNLLIDRGLIHEEKVNLSSFDLEKFLLMF